MAIRERLVYAIDVVTDGATKGLSNFKSAVSGADGAVGKFKAGASSAFGAVKEHAGIAAVAVGGSLVAAGAKALSQFTDLALSVEKFSKATGLSTEEASRWVEVAGDLGISTEQVQGGFVKLEKAVASGTPAVKALGIELQHNADGSANVSATMLQAIKALEGVRDPTLKAKYAAELFGKGFADMAELVTGDADKIKTALGEVSNAKIIDEKEIEKAKRNRENLDRLRDTIEDLALTLGESLGPALEGAADGLESLNTVMSTLKIDKLIALTGKFDDLGTTIGNFFGDLAYGPDRRKANEALVKGFNESEQAAADFDTTLIDGLGSFDQVRAKVIALGESEHTANLVALEWKKSHEEASAATDVLAAAVEGYAAVASSADAATELHKQHVDEVREAIFREGEITADTTAAVVLNAQAEKDAAFQASAHADAIADLQAKFDKLQKTLSDRSSYLDIEEAFEDVGTAAQEAWDASVAGAEDATQKARDHEQAVINLKQKVIDYSESVGNIPPEVVSEINALIDQGSLDEAERKLAWLERRRQVDLIITPRAPSLNQYGRVVGNARGTSNWRGGVTLVGEEGPELVDLPAGSAIHPANKTSAMLSGGGSGVGAPITIHLNVQQALTPNEVIDLAKKYERLNGAGWRGG